MANAGLHDPVRRQIAQTLQHADRLRHAGQMSEAEQLCRTILNSFPNNVETLNYLAILLKLRGAYDEAKKLLSRALSLMPGEAALHNNLGNVLRDEGKLEAAEQAYRKAISLRYTYPEAHYNLGIVLGELGRPEEALEALNTAAKLSPGYADALAQIASIEIERGRFDIALERLRDALAAVPNHFASLYYRGLALGELGWHVEAAAELCKAAAFNPQSHEAHYALGNALAYCGEEEEALEAYRKTISAKPDFMDAHYDFTSLAWTMGRPDLQFTSYAIAREKIGDTPDLLLAEGSMRLRFKDNETAQALLRKAHALAPERADIVAALGQALIVTGHLDEGIAQLERAMERDRETLRYRHEHAVALLRAGKAVEAEQSLNIARQLAPTDQMTWGLTALAWRELSDPRQDYIFDPSQFVRVYDLPPPSGSSAQDFNHALAEELAKLHTRKLAPFDQTLRGGTQTAGRLFDRTSPVIASLKERIAEIVAEYIATLPDDPDHPFLGRKSREFSFTGSWSCRLASQGFHTNHVHPQGWISSAYYVSLPEEVTHGGDPQGWLKFGESNLGLGEKDRPARLVQPAVGRLVLFPSYFWHGTIPFQASGMRLTVAFDVVPGKVKRLGGTFRNY